MAAGPASTHSKIIVGCKKLLISDVFVMNSSEYVDGIFLPVEQYRRIEAISFRTSLQTGCFRISQIAEIGLDGLFCGRIDFAWEIGLVTMLLL